MKQIDVVKNQIRALDDDRRVALARIVSDLVKADRVIDDDEIDSYNAMFGPDMSRQLFLNAQSYTFAEAMKLMAQPMDQENDSPIVKKRNAETRGKRARAVIEAVTQVANCDGVCDPSEAILLTAINYFLMENQAGNYDVQSYMLQDFFVAKRFVIFIETYPSRASESVEKNYNTISQLFASIGLQFIYVPRLAQLYASKDLETFKNMTMYFFPTITESVVEEIYHTISCMTTKIFVEEYLCKKMHMNLRGHRKPSLLVMLGNSDVVIEDAYGDLKMRRFADFLNIRIDDDVLSVVDKFITDFNRRVSYTQYFSFNPSNERLMYQGAYKLFFNLVALPEKVPMQRTVNVSPKKHKIFINDTSLSLPLSKLALYALIIHSSVIGDNKGIPVSPTCDEILWIDKRYKRIYSFLKDSNEVDIGSPVKRLTVTISEINKELEQNFKGLSGILKIGVDKKRYSVQIKAEDITVDRIPMLEHQIWREL